MVVEGELEVSSQAVKDDVAAVLARVFANTEESAIPKRFSKKVARGRAVSPRITNPAVVAQVHPEKVKRKGTGRGMPGVPRPPKYSRAQIVTAWEASEVKTLAVVAKQIGCHKQTVHRALVEQGIIVPSGQGGARPKEYCDNGHDMAKHSKPVVDRDGNPKGGRYCVPCKAKSGRERNQRLKAERQAARVS